MPGVAKTKRRPGRPPRRTPAWSANFRLEFALWERFVRAVEREGTSASAVLRAAVEDYVAKHGGEGKRPAR